MDAPPQSPAFDPYAYRSPQVPSTRGNVERPLPIHDDEDDEVVPETQNLASGRIGGDRIEEKKRVGGSRAHIGTTRDDEKLQLRSRYENIP
ncbi:hypothetical protein HanXRQr2_Chr15g0678861 [Helianthus annuus]|uniref:Uncharacterized protein n=1 Tax=Helianthus annuus TaxID=4232 RepID=A0A251S7U7_HELAN|nr:hypothetical protein HanXRQr2_Chr15g0678861 [Helianthus annuus]KAJ0830055.1 hypothetical protein HanPSC8_Chr15g0650821 [Helianthus annuus]